MSTKDLVDIGSNIVTAAATILAGGWAYYRFVKGRVFKPRLTLAASARQIRIEGTNYIISAIQLSNVGLSRIDLSGATLRVSSMTGKPAAQVATLPQRDWLDTSKVLLAHTWIESGEVLREQHLLILPTNHPYPTLVEYRLVVKGVAFSATAIVVPHDNEPSADDRSNSL